MQLLWVVRHLGDFLAAIKKHKTNPDYPNSNMRTPQGLLMSLGTGGDSLDALLELTQTITPKPLHIDSLKERTRTTKLEQRELLLRKI